MHHTLPQWLMRISVSYQPRSVTSPSVYLRSLPFMFTLPVGLQQLVFGDIYPWGQLMGASLLMALPVVIMYTYAQKYMVEGLTAGSVKG